MWEAARLEREECDMPRGREGKGKEKTNEETDRLKEKKREELVVKGIKRDGETPTQLLADSPEHRTFAANKQCHFTFSE